MNWVLSTPFEEQRLLRVLQWIAWAAFTGVICMIGALLWESEENLEWKERIPAIKGAQEFSFEKIGQGPLSLGGPDLSPLYTALSRDLIVLGKNSRPDVKPIDRSVLLMLCGSGQQKLVKSGTPIFLEPRHTEKGGWEGIQFSNDPSQIWLVARPIDEHTIKIEVGESPLFSDEKKRQFSLPVASSHSKLGEQILLAPFQTARLLGQDRLFEKYGGTRFKPLGSKQKIELPGEGAPSLLFVQQGDLLTWKEGQWIAGSDSRAPIAQIEKVTPQDLTIRVWSTSGLASETVVITKVKPQPLAHKPDTFLTKVHLRTSNQVTALIAGKRIILKQGDWLLKGKNGWRNLRTKREMDAYLNHTLAGQLFIFDAIDLQQGGTKAIRGTLFDETRTQMELLTIPIHQERTARKEKRKIKK